MSSNPCHRSADFQAFNSGPSSKANSRVAGRATDRIPTKPLRCPFPYFGGKFPVVEIVNRRLGEVCSFREPFAGSAALTLARQPVEHEALNDVNHYIVNFWRAIQRDPAAVAEHAHYPVTEADLHARSNYLFAGDAVQGAVNRITQDPHYYDPQLAGWYAWGRSCQIANAFEGNQKSKPNMRGNGICTPIYRTRRARQLAILDWFEALAERLHNVRILHGDWSRLVSSPSALGLYGKNGKSVAGVFLDPPYAHDINRVRQLLGIEQLPEQENQGRTDCYLCDSDHARVDQLVANVNTWCQQSGSNPRLRIALCGYAGEHDNLVHDHGWEKYSWTAQGGWANCGSQSTRGKANKAKESIWFSPHCVGD